MLHDSKAPAHDLHPRGLRRGRRHGGPDRARRPGAARGRRAPLQDRHRGGARRSAPQDGCRPYLDPVGRQRGGHQDQRPIRAKGERCPGKQPRLIGVPASAVAPSRPRRRTARRLRAWGATSLASRPAGRRTRAFLPPSPSPRARGRQFRPERTQLGRVSGRSNLAEAIRYALRHWQGLVLFLDDGRLELDTNVIERAIRPISLGRKNSLFAGSDGGPCHWAIVASLVASAKLNGVEPLAWLTDVLERVVSGRTKAHELEQLLPWAWKAERPAAAVNA